MTFKRTYQLLSTDGFIVRVSMNSLVSAGLVVSGTFLYPRLNIGPAPATPEAIPHPLTAYKPMKRSLKEKAIENIITFAF